MPEIAEIQVGLANILIQHTSASLTLNENACADVRRDFRSWFDDAVPEDAPYWTHTLEGADDMPAHIKASLTGPELTLPVRDGELALGTTRHCATSVAPFQLARTVRPRATARGAPSPSASHGIR